MKTRSILSLLLCLTLLFSSLCLTGCNGNGGKQLDGAKLLTYGDSLTAFGTWPLTVAENCNMYLFNGATGGINTKEALDRFDRYVANRDPDFVTLCFGMNDLLMVTKNIPQVKPDQFKENMKLMCEKIIELDATPILMTSSYMNEDVFFASQGQSKGNYTDVGTPIEWLDQYNDKVRELAEEEGYHLVDIRAACDAFKPTDLLVSDGIHLGPRGNQLYADELSAYLTENFKVNPKAERITTWFPYVASPDEPATTEILSYDPAMWDSMELDKMTIENDADGALLISNMNGKWPAAEYAATESVLVPMEGSELVFDISTANVNTSILLFFGGSTPFAPTEGKYVVINNKLGGQVDAGSGDVKSNQTLKGSVKLTDLGIPQTALDANGNLLISGVKVFAAGSPFEPVTIRQLAVSTTGAPVTK